ncbi:DNA (cytosine-5)-methyltransferase CMT3-like [Argentina anserina]|uniref:DNA (cytosine-5)-methyltransferase CMT3-like n=1 Tax=Argentina anserina TaxID=57926 RepID=UPI0021767733|nr:DNA (cytosine-5)-methyltransferase CMT3-like [Potentilla anserina]
MGTDRNKNPRLRWNNKKRSPREQPPLDPAVYPVIIDRGEAKARKKEEKAPPASDPESDTSMVVDGGEVNPEAANNQAESPPASAPESKKRQRGEDKAASPSKKSKGGKAKAAASFIVVEAPEPMFVGKPLSDKEARRRWPETYIKGDENPIQARRHFTTAEVDGVRYHLDDDAHVQAEEGKPPYICKIIEMFEAVDSQLYFTAQWYYRVKDTAVKKSVAIDTRRIFYSDVKDRNSLDCLLEKISIVRLALHVDPDVKDKLIEGCKYYCNTKYVVLHSSFVNLLPDNKQADRHTASKIVVGDSCDGNSELTESSIVKEQCIQELKVLDLYAGCGAMSTGLCLGARLSNVNLVTKWAVDINKYALQSLKLNHPETEVRMSYAENFLMLLQRWKDLCICFNLIEGDTSDIPFNFVANDTSENDDENLDNVEDPEAYEVERILDICYGEPDEKDKGLYLKVHWKGYDSDEDTWEPLDSLRDCKNCVEEFVSRSFNSKLLPLPGDVDVVCGGPPCQGISGYNRFRNKKKPLEDKKNKQAIVFMDIVQHLKPKYVLMENVVDLLKFAKGFLGRYAIGRLVDMNYQTRIGMMGAGAYGLPQYRMRVFLWGACPTECLPQYPLPTHDVIVKGHIPKKWEDNVVCSEGHQAALREKLLLGDALSDLPAVEYNELRDEMPYGSLPQTEFQKMIRLSKNYLLGSSRSEPYNVTLYDHQPLKVSDDDYDRILCIPKVKGANFRNLEGVLLRPDGKTVYFDPAKQRALLKSGNPLVPDYAMSFKKGKSKKPFGRLWWDEIVSTVVTRAEPHNHIILHPEQDRVLTIRENARLQGFPDYYKLCGTVKERYIQVGNAVAFPVARALGYALGRALIGSLDDSSMFELPLGFPNYPEELPSP